MPIDLCVWRHRDEAVFGPEVAAAIWNGLVILACYLTMQINHNASIRPTITSDADRLYFLFCRFVSHSWTYGPGVNYKVIFRLEPTVSLFAYVFFSRPLCLSHYPDGFTYAICCSFVCTNTLNTYTRIHACVHPRVLFMRIFYWLYLFYKPIFHTATKQHKTTTGKLKFKSEIQSQFCFLSPFHIITIYSINPKKQHKEAVRIKTLHCLCADCYQ